ncbi:MAG TPA: hypothetical protein VGN18_17535 [Jatrophihabitans sp.]|uniref:hypothetical protein n=1 Tax=Jatrophihabitans sp. TaxID=1932789 RepID=UPI002E0710C5|nr:hypothetical protein [Jatrophihabitans sp.]
MTAMPNARLRLAVTLVVAATLAACASSTTRGSGVAASPTGSSGGSTADFPASSGGAGSSPPSSGPASPPASSPVIPAPATPIETHTVTSDNRTYVVQVWVRKRDTECITHAHGKPLLDFLRQHPCLGLERVLATTTVGGRPVGYAESSTGFRSTTGNLYANAAEFKRLELADNTGSINDLLSEGYRLPRGPTSIPPGEAFGVIGQDNGVAVWDVWYLDGPTQSQDKALLQVITDLYLQF